MFSTHSRRSFISLFAGAAAGAATGVALAGARVLPGGQHAALAQSDDEANIGSTREEFAATFGEGVDVDGGLVQYGSSDSNTAVYYVSFSNDGIAENIEVDLTHLPGGGLPEEEADAGNSRFLPDDSVSVVTFRVGAFQFEFDQFELASWQSPTLAGDTGRSGNVLVVDEHGVLGDGMEDVPPFTRAMISMETAEVQEVVPQGEGTTLTGSYDAWTSVYGSTGAAQRAALVENPPITGQFLLAYSYDTRVVTQIDAQPDTELPVAEAIDFIGEWLPADAVLEQTFLLPPSPTGPVMLRIHIWTLPAANAQAMSMLYINGTESDGTVPRILMGTAMVE